MICLVCRYLFFISGMYQLNGHPKLSERFSLFFEIENSQLILSMNIQIYWVSTV